jgi:anti-anti-sigma regulatory factor/HAMP domain-containing protein
MARTLTIHNKILGILVLVSVLAAGISALTGFTIARGAIEKQEFKKLTAVREMKAREVEAYFQQIRNQVQTLSEDRMIVNAMKAFKAAFHELVPESGADEAAMKKYDRKLQLYYLNEFLPRLTANSIELKILSDVWPEDDSTRLLQHLYITENPFETGNKHLLDESNDASTYSQVHRLYHPIIRNFLVKFGYYDIFLVDHETGHIVYTVFKEVDYGTSLLSGPYRNTNFSRAFRSARKANHKDFVRLEDFEPYAPSYDAHASFIASPIFDGTEKIGVLLFQMPVERINDIMTNNATWSTVGLGETGETYIVGEDFTIRNQPRFLIEDKQSYLKLIAELGVPDSTVSRIAGLDNAIGLQEVRTEGSIAALEGETDTRIFDDYLGVRVLSAYKPLGIGDVNWAIMSEIDESEAFQANDKLRNAVVTWLAVLIVLSIVVAIVFSRTLTRPLVVLSERAAEVAQGRLETEIDLDREDELGDLAKSFDLMRTSIKEMLDRQASAIDALSTPLIPFRDEVLIMPLVGELDERRTEQLRNTLVEGLHQAGAKVAIIDLTGVPPFDETVATGLIRAARGARLMGAQIVITGMRADLANSLAKLDFSFEGMVVKRSLEDGIEYAMTHVIHS